MSLFEVFKAIGLFARTLRNLKGRQVAYLLLRGAQRAVRRSAPGLYGAACRPRFAVPAPACDTRRATCAETARVLAETLAPLAGGPLEQLKAGEIQALGRTARVAELDWEAELDPPLWGYRVHYFDEALPLALAAARGDAGAHRALRDWVLLWIRRCRVPRGPGWDPYPVSQRLRNWAWADLLLSAYLRDPKLVAALRRSAVLQASYLARHLERDLLGNHVLKNATALYLAGLAWPAAREAARWRRLGERLIRTEVAEQVLTDGGHFERSPTYHGAALLDLVEVNLLARAAGVAEPVPAEVIHRMVRFHTDLAYPDGARARFNDSAEGLVPEAAAVNRLYGVAYPTATLEARAGPIRYPDTGYYGYLDPGRGEAFVIDAGPPGPRYQPGHAHCDLLSFELYLDGRPWIVDPGVCGYAGDPFRAYSRSTRAHNTLCLDGREQSEIWGNFRMARMARVVSAEIRTRHEGEWEFVGSYVPYYDARIRHERRVRRHPDGAWEIADAVEGGGAAAAAGALTFHPDVAVELDGRRVLCTCGRATLVIEVEEMEALRVCRGATRPVDGWFLPAFGVAIPATTLRYRLPRGRGQLLLRVLRRA